jgi:hypothetical protein
VSLSVEAENDARANLNGDNCVLAGLELRKINRHNVA